MNNQVLQYQTILYSKKKKKTSSTGGLLRELSTLQHNLNRIVQVNTAQY